MPPLGQPYHSSFYTLTADDAIKFAKDCSAGATAAAIAKTIIAPIERVKLILQLQTSQRTIAVESRYKGLVDCLLRLPKEQGILSYWRGNMSNILRASSQESLGMAFKEFFKIWCVNDSDKNDRYGRFLAGNLLSGGLAGCVTFYFIYPLDFSRTRLAVDMGKDAASREFHGLVDCFIKITKHDGIFGLYRGFLPSLSYIFMYRSVYYGLFDSLKIFFDQSEVKAHHKEGRTGVSFSAALCIGQISAIVAALFSYPLDTVRRRLMMQSGQTNRDYKNTLDCARKIYHGEGAKAFFSGFFVNAIRGFGAALVLAIYNDIAKWM